MFPNNPKRTFVVEWAKVRARFLDEIEGRGQRNPYSVEAFENLRNGTWAGGSFLGATKDQAIGWVRNGYNPPEFAHAAGYVQPVMHGSWVYDEEGENVDVGAALSGDDEPFVDWAEAPSRPGLKLNIELAFLGSTPARVIAEYGAWVAGMLSTFETQGIDLELDVELPSQSGLCKEDQHSANQMIVRVKRPGEIMPFEDWSSLFSPSGFRTLGFTTRAMACEEWGMTCRTGFGQSGKRPNWDAQYDANARHLSIHRPPSPTSFDAERLTKQIADFGLLA